MPLIDALKPYAHLTTLALADFTTQEQEAIAAKVQQLVADGRDPEQALGIAIGSCAPDKAVGQLARVGGAYDWIENPDGTIDVFDVPIMGAIPEGEHGNAVPVDEAFMRQAVARARERLRNDAYLPPLHVRHHPDDRTEHVGHFLPRRVETRTYDGQEMPVVIADLKRVKREYLEPMQRGELPYRSIEINDLTATPEIDSLALLTDEVPFFRFPLLTLGRKIAAAALPDGAVATYAGKPARGAYRGAGGDAAFLFRMEAGMTLEERVDKIESTLSKLAKKLKLEDDEKEESKAKAGDDKDDDGAGKAKSKAGEESKPVEEPDEKAKTKAGDDEPEKEKAAAGATADDDSAMRLAAAEGRLAAVEGKLAERDQRDDQAGMVKAALAKLKGYPQPANIEERLALFAGKGQDALDAFVEAYQATTTKEPPKTLADLEAAAAAGEDTSLPEEVLKLRSRGPEAFEAGVAAYRRYQELKGTAGYRLTLQQHLDANVASNN